MHEAFSCGRAVSAAVVKRYSAAVVQQYLRAGDVGAFLALVCEPRLRLVFSKAASSAAVDITALNSCPERPVGSICRAVPRWITSTGSSMRKAECLWVSDFTYLVTWAGFVYVAFGIDAYARRIVGWRVSRTAHVELRARCAGAGPP